MVGVDPLLVAKLVAVPVLVLAASLVARRWGPRGGGFIIGLPLTSGPVLVFLALEQGASFASQAAIGTMLGVVPLALYCLTFSRMGFVRGWLESLVASTVVYFLSSAILSQVDALPLLALAASLISIAISLALIPRGVASIPDRALPWWEIPARIVAATTLVVLVTGVASELGPRWSGLLAPYPIYATVFSVFMLRFDGPKVSGPFLRGVVVSAIAATAFYFVFWGTVGSLGVVWAATASLFATLLVQASSILTWTKVWRTTSGHGADRQGRTTVP